MWLLDTYERVLPYFHALRQSYAFLSYIWGSEVDTHQELQALNAQRDGSHPHLTALKAGYVKIEARCE